MALEKCSCCRKHAARLLYSLPSPSVTPSCTCCLTACTCHDNDADKHHSYAAGPRMACKIMIGTYILVYTIILSTILGCISWLSVEAHGYTISTIYDIHRTRSWVHVKSLLQGISRPYCASAELCSPEDFRTKYLLCL